MRTHLNGMFVNSFCNQRIQTTSSCTHTFVTFRCASCLIFVSKYKHIHSKTTDLVITKNSPFFSNSFKVLNFEAQWRTATQREYKTFWEQNQMRTSLRMSTLQQWLPFSSPFNWRFNLTQYNTLKLYIGSNYMFRRA